MSHGSPGELGNCRTLAHMELPLRLSGALRSPVAGNAITVLRAEARGRPVAWLAARPRGNWSYWIALACTLSAVPTTSMGAQYAALPQYSCL